MDEIESLHEADPNASAYYAIREMHYGRLEWLAEHIRRCNFQIDPSVARKILAMLGDEGPMSFFELKAVRRSGLPPRLADPQLTEMRNFDMAIEIARTCGFKRGLLRKAYADVAKRYGLQESTLPRLVRPYQRLAMDVVADEKVSHTNASA